MSEDFLRPTIDGGSSRVFDCNGITLKLRQREDTDGRLFFLNSRLNNVVIVKTSVPPEDRRTVNIPAIGTKLYFPFDEASPYSGGNTIFVHDRNLEAALAERCGLDRRHNQRDFDEDVRLLRNLERLPTLDPFLLKDMLQSELFEINPEYLEIGPEEWTKIEEFIRQRFVPLIRAAFPVGSSSHDKTMQLVEKLWEGKDEKALAPLIRALRLPEEKAMEIFYGWKVITFYSSLYAMLQPQLVELAKWLKDADSTVALLPSTMRPPFEDLLVAVKNDLREQWLMVDRELKEFESAYEKMFVDKQTSPFIAFLRNCREVFWRTGDGIGKIDHTVLCWDRLTARHHRRHLNLEGLQHALRVFDEILGTTKSRLRAAG